jgi:phosphatidic acid-selective phospholipase A1
MPYLLRFYENFFRFSGSDPAGPFFQGKPKDERLDNTDAHFVDIVHTNQLQFGYFGALGDVDFLVNGGGPVPMPGCLSDAITVRKYRNCEGP